MAWVDEDRRKLIKPRTGDPEELQEALKDPDLWTDAMPYHFFSLAGGPQVGKSAIVERMFGREFNPEAEATVGGRFMYDIGPFGDEEDFISVWDCSGAVYTDWHVRKDDKGNFLKELKFIGPNARLGRMIYRKQMRKTMGCKQCAVVIVYDATNRDSFDGVKDSETGVESVNGVDMFLRWAKYRQGEDALVALVAAKCDLADPQVAAHEGRAKVRQWNQAYGETCYFFETSAKANTGISEMVELMAEKLVSRHENHESPKVYPWEVDRLKLIEDGYEPEDVENVLLDEEGHVAKTIELFHNQDDMEDRIGLW